MSKTFKTIILSIIVAFTLVYGALAISVSAGVGLPFGGKVVATTFCNCSGNFLVKIVNAVPIFGGFFTYQPGVTLPYSYYTPMVVRAWDLGTYVPGTGYCVVGACGTATVVIPTFGAMTMVGNSIPAPK